MKGSSSGHALPSEVEAASSEVVSQIWMKHRRIIEQAFLEIVKLVFMIW